MVSARRERLDVVLVERGLAPNRTKAQALVIAGRVSSGHERLDKPGVRIDKDLPLDVAPGRRYVGRGGEKAAGAFEAFAVSPARAGAIDVGASTGGFTQVLLEQGFARVIALDVGRGQLDWSLRTDDRVTVIEGVNARHLTPETLPFVPTLATVDVSFISLRLVLPAVAACLAPGGEILALVKPQFEVGRGQVGRGGIVRRPELHRQVLDTIASFAIEQGLGVLGAGPSPITGADGNREFFLHLATDRPGLDAEALEAAVEAACAAPGSAS